MNPRRRDAMVVTRTHVIVCYQIGDGYEGWDTVAVGARESDDDYGG